VSEKNLDLRSSMQIVRRRKVFVAVAVLAGLLAGGGYGARETPMLSSTALVVLPGTVHSTATQVIIADSSPVLARATGMIDPAIQPQTLRSRVKVKSLTANIISITASGVTASQAEDAANAVAESYVGYVRAAHSPVGQTEAGILQRASAATGTSKPVHMVIIAGLGALIGALVSTITALAIDRGDRRLRDRDDIADSIGVPVLASIRVSHPSSPGGWARLLEEYRPTAVEAWRLRSALDQLGAADSLGPAGVSVGVLTLSRDRGALAVGPQIAAFAAGLGIPTALVFGPQQGMESAATLRAACAALAEKTKPVGRLRVMVTDQPNGRAAAGFGLAVVVAVVDDQTPSPALTARTTATVLAVTSGFATAEQLARVAASAFADGRHISGIVVADPDPADRTTGRIPQPVRPAHRRTETRAFAKPAETRS
jgi:capsular polysaccharide biosynthesis protein